MMHGEASESLLPSPKKAFCKPSEQVKRFVFLLLFGALLIYMISPHQAVGTFFFKSKSGEASVGPTMMGAGAKLQKANDAKAPALTFGWKQTNPKQCPTCGRCLGGNIDQQSGICFEASKIACWELKGKCPPSICTIKAFPNVVPKSSGVEKYCTKPRPQINILQCFNARQPRPCGLDLQITTVSQGTHESPPPGNRRFHDHNCWLGALLTARNYLAKSNLISTNNPDLTMDEAIGIIERNDPKYKDSQGYNINRIQWAGKQLHLGDIYNSWQPFDDYKSQIGACIQLGWPIIAGIGYGTGRIFHYVVISGVDRVNDPKTMLINDPWNAKLQDKAFGRPLIDSRTGLGCRACNAIRDGLLSQGQRIQQLYFPRWFNPETGKRRVSKSL